VVDEEELNWSCRCDYLQWLMEILVVESLELLRRLGERPTSRLGCAVKEELCCVHSLSSTNALSIRQKTKTYQIYMRKMKYECTLYPLRWSNDSPASSSVGHVDCAFSIGL
jgi:hypothetical protein